jgi:uncharacterized membrane protein
MTQTRWEAQGGSGGAPFRAVLRPTRSLSPAGFAVLMGCLGVVCIGTGALFMLVGAWPVFGFFGLDLALVYLAFKLNYRSGRLVETVEIAGARLALERVHPSGQREAFEFNPYWTRVHLDEAVDGRTRLLLGSHDRRVDFAAFLSDDERRDLAIRLSAALGAARRGQF